MDTEEYAFFRYDTIEVENELKNEMPFMLMSKHLAFMAFTLERKAFNLSNNCLSIFLNYLVIINKVILIKVINFKL